MLGGKQQVLVATCLSVGERAGEFASGKGRRVFAELYCCHEIAVFRALVKTCAGSNLELTAAAG